MNLYNLATLRNCKAHALVAAMSFVLLGCSAKKAGSGAPAPAVQSSAESRKSPKGASDQTNAPLVQSTFSIDRNSRDPFFPKAKRVIAETETAKQPEAAIDLTALLQAAFQGTVGNDKHRIALVNNVMLEPGRQTVIPISAAGQSRSVSVRCREVLRDAVVLEVQGYAQPVRLVRTAIN